MKKKEAKTTIIVVMLLAVALYFVGGTYARYASEFTGSQTVTVAKWAVKAGGSTSSTLTLSFTEEANDNVVNGRFAPSSKLTAPLEVDLSETEVAVEVIIDTESDAFKTAITNLGMKAEDVTLTIVQDTTSSSSLTGITGSGTQASPFVIPLQSGAKFAANSVVKFNIVLEWKNNEHNTEDTTAGTNPATVSIPVKVIVQQHI